MPFLATRTTPTPLALPPPHTEEHQEHMMTLAPPTLDLTGKSCQASGSPRALTTFGQQRLTTFLHEQLQHCQQGGPPH